MLGSAWRNHGRTVTCDLQTITVSQAFRPMRILLDDVKRVVREDVRQQMRDIENIGVSRYERMRRLDTRARSIVYALYDAQGHTLLRLDEAMEPAPAMRRFLARMESIAGPIATSP